MGKIIVLSSEIANQIAAGEVVERPASVIKELIENSLDAKARHIEVRIKGGGLDYMVVQDDGVGMDADDLALCIKRYATSKLKNAGDLFHIKSFGFRGEALPSIASIAHMSLISRPPEQDFATKAILKAGEIVEMVRASSTVGTRIEVRDLFFNVPARLKFIKTKRSEIAFIDSLIRAYAFAYPGCSWQLFSDEQLLFSAPSGDKRASALLGRDTENYLFKLDERSDLLQVSGVICAPLVTRRDSRSIYIFINGRLVNDRKLIQAVRAAFRTLLEVGRHPICALRIELLPEEIDVNAHPQKAEVRFADERRVMSHFISLVGDFLSKTPWLTREPKAPTLIASALKVSNTRELFEPLPPLYRPQNTTSRDAAFSMSTNALLPAKKFSDLRVIGQVQTTYLLLESDDGLVVVDQHAAHERVVFEKIRHAKNPTLSSAPLLIPLTIELDRAQMALFLDFADELFRLGLEVEPFSEQHLVLRSVPDFIKNENAKTLFDDVLSELSHLGRSDSLTALYDAVCASIACHGSIRAGQRLSMEEMKALLVELDSIDFNAHCPHGRPVVKSFLESEIKKWFHRT